MTTIRLALAQINTRLGDVRGNLDKHLEYIRRARAEAADLVVFPELSLSGYVLQDLSAQVALRRDDAALTEISAASRDLDVVVGFPERDERERLFISAAYFARGEIVHVHRKVYLPTYGLFDEGRFFAWGDDIHAFDTRFGRVGLLICEDFWHVSPPYLLWLDGAELLLLISASPGRGLREPERLETAAWVERINQAYASLFTAFVVHINRVGFEDGLTFWGGATAFDPHGALLARGPHLEEALTTADLDLAEVRRARTRLPLLRDERTALVQRELARILARPAPAGR